MANYITFSIKKFSLAFFTVILVCIGSILPLSSQANSFFKDSAAKTTDKTKRDDYRLHAVRVISSDLKLDGKLDEAAWADAKTISNFTQRSPVIGSSASENTAVKFLYDNDALYIGAILYDSSPDSIAAPLFRRDEDGFSDWFFAGIDSYNDERTAFVFATNPRGVQKDLLFYNDNQEDTSWDAVWESSAVIHEDGWSVEMRIPLSQIRYNQSKDINTMEWGINFSRHIARKDEVVYWSPTPPDDSGIVSKFGRLDNLNNLPKKNQLEFIPYISSKLDRTPLTGQNPFINEYESSVNVGADISYGLSSNMTLTATLNPDFGQVEVDPAEVNLSAFETFFPERRPFFLEGSEIFDFGFRPILNLGGTPQIFYSRRIGRAPQGSVPSEAAYSDVPSQTPIAGAVKLSGKTPGGWSVGLINAVTRQNDASYSHSDGRIESIAVEPLTNYSVGRLQKDFRGGKSVVGVMMNSVIRNPSQPALAGIISDQAYSAGADFQHQWNNRKFRINGKFAASQVSGSKAMISRLQQSSARYYQRPGADHLNLDLNRGSLSGVYGDLMVTRQTRHWITQFRGYRVSPGFEVNDLGFQTAADRSTFTGVNLYKQPEANGIFRNYSVFTLAALTFNTAGDLVGNMTGIGSSFRFKNFWSVSTEVLGSLRSYDDRLTRGGPMGMTPASMKFNTIVSTDYRKKLQLKFTSRQTIDELGGHRRSGSVMVRYRPLPAANFSIEPQFTSYKTTTQYAGTIQSPSNTATFGKRYLFADMHQQTLAASIRADWTFSPKLSLQLFAQPFISAGEFSRFKELERAGSMDYKVYDEESGSVQFNSETNRYEITPGDIAEESFEIRNPNFNVRSIRGNAVLRWEYRPGSTVFFVWQQTRSSRGNAGTLNLADDYDQLFRSPANHAFLVKLSFWLGT
ncbi:DUF5916 domain-containing protein [Rhodohalobacter sp. 8-1]|uniref:DUF5916 domain-containing protein n=1 Tax=Rhodohalobacter sp. 8-1 TaxID=3131972 RepID=UPI0030EE3F54